MIVAVWVPVLIGLLLPAAVQLASRAASPGTATGAMTILGLAGGLCWLWGLVLLTVRTLLPFPPDADPVPHVAAAVVAPVALWLCARAGIAATRQLRHLRGVDRALGRSSGEPVLHVVSGSFAAHAVAGLRRQRIDVGEDLLAALAPRERQALIAHERAHLRGRHTWLRSGSRVAAAAHPGLRGLPAAVDGLCERWADESAAREVGDRSVVARALSVAALASLGSRPSPAISSFGGTGVMDRVTALMGDAPTSRSRSVLTASAAVVAVAAAAAAHATWDALTM